MMLFRVDRTNLCVEVFTDPTAKMNNSSVWLEGKRRDRVTDRYIWFDDMDEAMDEQSKAIHKKQVETTAEINALNQRLESLEALAITTRKNLNVTIQKYNNDSFFD